MSKEFKPGENESSASAKERLNGIIQKINKQSGRKTVKLVGSDYSIDRLSTGILPLDMALGGSRKTGYGLPKGKITEFSGPPFAGKTSITYATMASAQKAGLIVAYVDTEGALDPVYAQKFGVNLDELLHLEPENAEEGFEAALTLLDSPDIGLVVYDSIVGSLTKNMVENEFEKREMGQLPHFIGKFAGLAETKIKKTGCVLVLINQIRDNLSPYGGGVITPGGKALKHFCAARVQLTSANEVYEHPETKEAAGNVIKGKTIKNRHSQPFIAFEFPLLYKTAVDKPYNLAIEAIKKKVIVRGGAWYSYGDLKLQGINNVAKAIRESEDLYNELIEAVYEQAENQND